MCSGSGKQIVRTDSEWDGINASLRFLPVILTCVTGTKTQDGLLGVVSCCIS